MIHLKVFGFHNTLASPSRLPNEKKTIDRWMMHQELFETGRSSFEKPLRFSKVAWKEDLDVIGVNLGNPPGFNGSNGIDTIFFGEFCHPKLHFNYYLKKLSHTLSLTFTWSWKLCIVEVNFIWSLLVSMSHKRIF